MTRRLLQLAIMLAVLAAAARAQQGNVVLIRFAGAPSGSCSPIAVAVNNATGEYFDCLASVWNSVGGTGGGGTVTSVGFTGGLISVATATTTPAFTVAGTSGGIPYFSGATTWASSAVLTASALVLGGGAGASPTVLGSLGTTTTVIHGNAAGAPTFGPIVAADITNNTITGTQLAASLALVTPLLGTPTSGVMTNVTGLTEAGLTLADNTTANASTSAHGFLLKLNNTATSFMNGQGAWATPAGSGATTALDNLASVAINAALLAGTDNSIALGSSSKRWTNLFSTALNCGIAGTTSCVLSGNGSISGTATLTWPATAGTTTNPIAISNVITLPVGAVGTPSWSFAGETNTGFYRDSAQSVSFSDVGTAIFTLSSNGIRNSTGAIFGWSTNVNPTLAGYDTAINRAAAGVVGVGTSNSVPDTTGRLKASAYMSVGTKFATDTGCGTVTSLTGGGSAGSFIAQATGACTVVITMGDSATAPNGWACGVSDRTTANLFRQTASSTTTATISGTAVTSDVISFNCEGY